MTYPLLSLRDQLIAVCHAYGAGCGIGRKRVSTLVFNRGSKLDDLVSGGDVATGTFERAMQWLSDNWPDGGRWPEGVPRPAPQRGEPGGACGAVCAPEMGVR